MSDATAATVPRTPDEPTPEQVLSHMRTCEPYTVGELEADLGEEHDASRWTIQRRLDALVDDGHVEKKQHAENRVSYWVAKE